MSRGWDYMPGVPAAGHLTPSGYWHPGALANCSKAPCKETEHVCSSCGRSKPERELSREHRPTGPVWLCKRNCKPERS